MNRVAFLVTAICLMLGLMCVTATALSTDCNHTYSGPCDAECNECGATRFAAQHFFENSEDDVCDQCGVSRKPHVPGDVNGDGNVNNKDLGLLCQYINKWDVTVDKRAADVNADGNINNKDWGLLCQYINRWDVTLKDPQGPTPEVEEPDSEDNWLKDWY